MADWEKETLLQSDFLMVARHPHPTENPHALAGKKMKVNEIDFSNDASGEQQAL